MLNVEISKAKIGPYERYEFLKPSSWLRYMDEHQRLRLILGTRTVKEAEPALELFWARFREQFPGHQVFERASQGRLQLSRTLPVYFHADEGRTLKKKALFLVQFQVAFGKGIGRKHDKETIEARVKNLRLDPNYVGNSLSTRFLCAFMLRSDYADNPEVLDELLELICADMATLGDDGFMMASGERIFLCPVGNKGDWDYLCKVAHLTRSFRNAPKFPTSSSPDKPMCHLCMAGSPHHPYEDVCLEQQILKFSPIQT